MLYGELTLKMELIGFDIGEEMMQNETNGTQQPMRQIGRMLLRVLQETFLEQPEPALGLI